MGIQWERGVGLRREGFCARVKHTPTTARPGVPRCSAETFAGSCSTPCLVLYRGRSLVIRVGSAGSLPVSPGSEAWR
jgi:hypothetical protein